MDEAETVDHALWGCEFAQKVWMMSAMQFSASMDSTMSFVEIIDHCFTDLQFPLIAIFFTTDGHYGRQGMRCFGKIKW
jgi:hypothetical protein